MKRLHLVVGWLGGASFVLTGLWMQINFPDAYFGDAGMRMAYRSAHVYTLLAAFMNSLLGVYLQPARTPLRAWLQKVGSVFILATPPIFTLAFFLEPAPGAMDRPFAGAGLAFGIYGTLLHLAAQRGAGTAPAPGTSVTAPSAAPAGAARSTLRRQRLGWAAGAALLVVALGLVVWARRPTPLADGGAAREPLDALLARLTIAASAEEREAVASAHAAGRRFADCGTGVIDLETNLMWAPRDNRNASSWFDARHFAEGSRAGGYTDWRLPTIAELLSLAEGMTATSDAPPREAPSVDSILPVGYGVPWSSETRGEEAARVHLSGGAVNWLSQQSTARNRALPVRGTAAPHVAETPRVRHAEAAAARLFGAGG